MRATLRLIVMAVAVLSAADALAACGTRGGPGYRDEKGKCVGWQEICRRCGVPPTEHCTPERANVNATKAAELCQNIQELRPKKPQ